MLGRSPTNPAPCSIGCKDAPFILCEIAFGGMAMTGALTNYHYWAWILDAAAFGCIGVAHLATRRFGNIQLLAGRMEQTANQAQHLADQAANEVRDIEKGIDQIVEVEKSISDDVDTLTGDAQILQGQLAQHKSQLILATQELQKLKQEREALTKALQEQTQKSSALLLQVAEMEQKNQILLLQMRQLTEKIEQLQMKIELRQNETTTKLTEEASVNRQLDREISAHLLHVQELTRKIIEGKK